MRILDICIISSLGAQSYEDKFDQSPSNWKPFWNCSLFKDNRPIDAVDFYNTEINTLGGHKLNNRHIFINGLIIGNRIKRKGSNVSIINIYDKTSVEHEKIIRRADAILISTSMVFSKWFHDLCEAIQRIRSINPIAKIIIGGFGVYRIFHSQKNEHIQLDKLIRCGANNIIISRDGIDISWEIITSNLSVKNEPIICDNSVWSISPEDYNIDQYSSKYQFAHTVILTSHGCPYSCSFCSYRYFLGPVRYEPISTVIKTFQSLSCQRKIKLNYLRIADESFNIPEKRAQEICSYLAKSNFKIPWCCFLKGDKVSINLAKSLKKAGCSMVSIGLESGSKEMQRIFNKNLNLKKVRKAINVLKGIGICVTVSLLVGYYGENKNTINETERFLKSSKPDLARINIWNPKPSEAQTSLAKQFKFSESDLGLFEMSTEN